VRVGGHRQEGCRMVPAVRLFRVGHPDQFAQRERAGVQADDAGKLPDESPDIDAASRIFSAAVIFRS
jgi:hypothetical protein